MKKRGFTLIEIIVCITLIGLVGIGGSVIAVKNKNNTLEKITKTILESAQVYLEMETDEKGNTFKDGLLLGGTAVSIPIKELVNTGYLKEDVIKTLEKEGISNAKNNYVLAAVFSGAVDECDDNQSVIEFKASWDEELKNSSEPVYLCEYSNEVTETIVNNIIKNETVINKIINNVIVVNEFLNLKVDLDKFAVSKEYYDTLSDDIKDKFTYEENGVYIYYNDELDVVYSYFRGAVDNNYLKLGKDSSGKDLYWRILWLSDDNRMKLVLDDEVPLYIKNGEDKKLITLNENNKVYYFKRKDAWTSTYTHFYFMNPTISREDYKTEGKNYTGYTFYYTYSVKDEDILENFIELGEEPYSNKWFYDQENISWYNNTNLNTYDFILKENNFCINECYQSDSVSLRNYSHSTNFDCKYGVYNEKECVYDKSKYKSSVVGYLNYGDLLRAGIPTNSSSSLLNSGNFLIKSQNNIITPDLNQRDIKSNYFMSNYYFSEYGLNSSEIADYYKGTSTEGSTTWRDYYFTLINSSTNTTLMPQTYDYSSYLIRKISTFVGNVLKPVIVIDMSDVELSQGDGTKDNPYIIEEKK